MLVLYMRLSLKKIFLKVLLSSFAFSTFRLIYLDFVSIEYLMPSSTSITILVCSGDVQ
jgi:hypothetical protein